MPPAYMCPSASMERVGAAAASRSAGATSTRSYPTRFTSGSSRTGGRPTMASIPRSWRAYRASIEEELTELKARLENPKCRDREGVLVEIKQTEKVLKIIGEALDGSRPAIEAVPIAHEDA